MHVAISTDTRSSMTLAKLSWGKNTKSKSSYRELDGPETSIQTQETGIATLVDI